MITKGFGVGHCFYLGKSTTANWWVHRFQCRNMGALAKPTLQLAFQFTISNLGKTFQTGTTSTSA